MTDPRTLTPADIDTLDGDDLARAAAWWIEGNPDHVIMPIDMLNTKMCFRCFEPANLCAKMPCVRSLTDSYAVSMLDDGRPLANGPQHRFGLEKSGDAWDVWKRLLVDGDWMVGVRFATDPKFSTAVIRAAVKVAICQCVSIVRQ